MKYILEYNPTPKYKQNIRLILLAVALVMDLVALTLLIPAIWLAIYINIAYASAIFVGDIILRLIANRLVFKYVYTYYKNTFTIEKVYPAVRKIIIKTSTPIIGENIKVPLTIDDYMRSRIL